MFVYFIRTCAKPSMVKIGKARDPEGRLAELQTGCPYDLVLVATIPCHSDVHAYRMEEAFHEVLARDHKRGEWFFFRDGTEKFAWLLSHLPDDPRDTLKAACHVLALRESKYLPILMDMFRAREINEALDQEFRAITA